MTQHDAKSLRAWARGAPTRANLCYFRGNLAETRLTDAVIDHMAFAAEQLSEDGVVDLWQSRLPDGGTAYWATRRSGAYAARPYSLKDRPCNQRQISPQAA